jgi:predicted nucleic acid-binding protein
MAGRAAGLIVVIDASTFVSAALKADSVPERALLRAVDPPNRLILSQAVEDEYCEVIFRSKFDRFVSIERRQRVLDIVVVAAERIEPTETVRESTIQRTTSTWRWPPPVAPM